MMASQWFAVVQGQTKGPMASKELAKLASAGVLKPTDLVWKDGMQKWHTANKVKRLFTSAPPSLPAAPPPLPAAPPPPPDEEVHLLDVVDDDDIISSPRKPRNMSFRTKVLVGVGIGVAIMFLGCCGIMVVSTIQSQDRTVGTESDIINRAKARLAESVKQYPTIGRLQGKHFELVKASDEERVYNCLGIDVSFIGPANRVKDVEMKILYTRREDLWLVSALLAETIVNPNHDKSFAAEISKAATEMIKELKATNLASGSARVNGYVISYFGDGNFVTFSIYGRVSK